MSATEQYGSVRSWWDLKVRLQQFHWLPLLLFLHLSALNQSFSRFLSLNPQVQESDAEDFGGYTLTFAEGELESKLKKKQKTVMTDWLLVVI